MSTFDWNKAVLEKYIFEGGDISKLSSFIKEQIELHSMNRLSGRIFNPIGFASNIVELSDNPIIEQTLKRLASDITGNAGIYDTTDGKTFGRVMDNDSSQTQIRDVDDFKESIQGSNSFLRSALRNVVNSFKNKVGQAVPFVEFTGTRSIMAQTLAYTNELFKENFKGTETQMESIYENEPAKETEYTNIDPIGREAINYTHSVYSIAMNDPLELRRIMKNVDDGLYAQNIAIEKPKVVSDQERSNILKKARQIGIQISNDVLNKNRDFWVRRTAEYNPNIRSDKRSLASGSRIISDREGASIYEVLFESRNINGTQDLYSLFLEEFYETNIGEFDEDRRNTQEERLERLKNDTVGNTESPERIFDNQATLYNPRYLKNRKNYQDNIDAVHNTSMSQLSSMASGSGFDDELVVMDITNSNETRGEDINHMFMSFEDVRTNKIIFLKPYIDGLTDDTQASYDESDYLGRTESIPKYRKTTGSLNFSFVLHASTPKELMMMYKKVEFIESLNYPIANSDFTIVKNPLVRFSLGDLYRNRGGYITAFSKSITDGESTWEMRKGYNVPKMIRCSITIQKLNDIMPYYETDYEFDKTGNSFNVFDMNYTNIE